jgi:hypothetical protein
LFARYGKEKVEMKKDEMKTIKSVGEQGLLLMGFKPRDRCVAVCCSQFAQFLMSLELLQSCCGHLACARTDRVCVLSPSRLRDWHNVKNPYFLYPDEASMKGSSLAFHALIQQMAQKARTVRFQILILRSCSMRVPTRFVAVLSHHRRRSPWRV